MAKVSHNGVLPDAIGAFSVMGRSQRYAWRTPDGSGVYMAANGGIWRARRDSNPRHLVPKTSALSAELRAPTMSLVVAGRGTRVQTQEKCVG